MASGNVSSTFLLPDKLADTSSKGNCEHRLPAPMFQVKKPGPNRGRWFYTCQKPKEEGCGFFLWDDDAKTREKQAVMNNVRSEVEERRSLSPTPTPASKPRSAEITVTSSKPRINPFVSKAPVIEISDGEGSSDEFGDWPLSMEEEEKAVQTVDEVDPSTPRKASKVDGFTTPGSKRKRDVEDHPPTPMSKSSTAGKDPFKTPTANRLKGGMWDGNEHLGLRTPSITPTPDRFHTAPTHPSPAPPPTSTLVPDTPSHPPSDLSSISTAILPLMTPHLPPAALTEIKDLLSKHELKLSGITRGRDISRQALKAKDREIAELKQRIIGLEAEREMDRAVLGRLRCDVRDSVERRRGGGGGAGRGRGRGNS